MLTILYTKRLMKHFVRNVFFFLSFIRSFLFLVLIVIDRYMRLALERKKWPGFPVLDENLHAHMSAGCSHESPLPDALYTQKERSVWNVTIESGSGQRTADRCMWMCNVHLCDV